MVRDPYARWCGRAGTARCPPIPINVFYLLQCRSIVAREGARGWGDNEARHGFGSGASPQIEEATDKPSWSSLAPQGRSAPNFRPNCSLDLLTALAAHRRNHISNDGSERRIAPKALDKFKTQVRDMTRRTRGISLPQLIEELRPYLIGWRGYFGFCQTPRVLTNREAWIRRRLGSYLWRQWQNGHNRVNCAVAAYRSSMQRSPLVHRPGSGACPDIRRSNRPCATRLVGAVPHASWREREADGTAPLRIVIGIG